MVLLFHALQATLAGYEAVCGIEKLWKNLRFFEISRSGIGTRALQPSRYTSQC
jgi:hypothetical protein